MKSKDQKTSQIIITDTLKYDDDGNIKEFYDVGNVVDATLFSRDEVQKQSGASDAEQVVLKEYHWTGGNRWYYANKNTVTEDKHGWITAYDYTTSDLGDFAFTTRFHTAFYNDTHETSGGYEHIDGKYVKIVSADDIVTAQPYGDIVEGDDFQRLYGSPVILDEKDYYYYKTDITISEYGVDVFNDETVEMNPETVIDTKNSSITRDWVIYGMYADAPNVWQPINLDNLGFSQKLTNGSQGRISVQEYLDNASRNKKTGIAETWTLNLNFADNSRPCPYRIKVEHNTIEYQSDIKMKVYMRILKESPNMSSSGPLRVGKFYAYEDEVNKTGLSEYNALAEFKTQKVDAESGYENPDFSTFYINLTNYTANTATRVTNIYNEIGILDTDKSSKTPIIDIFYNDTGKYRDFESNPYDSMWTCANANRYDFQDSYLSNGTHHQFYAYDKDTYPTIHTAQSDRPLSTLGSEILKPENLGGSAEYLPNDYIKDTEFNLYNPVSSTDANFLDTNRRILRARNSIVLSKLEENADARKYASWENDAVRGQVLMTYTLYGYEGYRLDSDMEQIIKQYVKEDEPLRHVIYFCDLLPPGANYYGSFQPVCGKLTTTQVGDKYRAVTSEDVDNFVDTWNGTQAKIISTKIIPDFNGTGRTLVRFGVKFENDGGETFPYGEITDESWYIGCGIRFKAHVPWDNYTTASEKDNIFAYVAGDDLHNGHLLGMYTGNASTSQIFDDAGRLIPYVSNSQKDKQDYTPFKDYANLDEDYEGTYEKDANGNYVLDNDGFRIIQYKTDPTTGDLIPDYSLDSNSNKIPDVSEHNRMYGHANAMESITTARTIGITKSVRADVDEDADYTARTSVIENHDYTYKIHIDRTEQGKVHNFIIFDKLENITPGTWKGTFNSIDLEEFNTLYGNISPAPKPQKYYSESHDAPTVLYIKSKNENGNPTAYTINKGDLEPTQFTEKNPTIVKDEWRATWNWETVNNLLGESEDSDGKLKKWYTETEWNTYLKTNPTAKIGSIAVDFSKDINGNPFNIPNDAVFNIYVHMTADSFDANKPYTLNNSSFHFTNLPEDTEGHYSTSNITTVTLGKKRTLYVKKELPEKQDYISNDLLKNVEFTFQVQNNLAYVKSRKLNPDDADKIENTDVLYDNFKYSNIEYKLYEKVSDDSTGTGLITGDNNSRYIQKNPGITYTTDDNGEFKLKYGQMAVFKEVVWFDCH